MKQIKRSSPVEQAIIRRAIAADSEAAKYTDEDFAQAHHAANVMPVEVIAGLPLRRLPRH